MKNILKVNNNKRANSPERTRHMGAEMFLTKREKAICASARISAKEYLLGRKAALEEEESEIMSATTKAVTTKTATAKAAAAKTNTKKAVK